MMDRRAFLKLLTGLGLSLLGAQAACQGRWPSQEKAANGGDGLPREAEAPSETKPTPNADLIVAIVRGDDPTKLVRNAVAMVGGISQVVHPGAVVFIKPNLTIPSASGLGNVTDSRILRATIDLCQEAGASRIIVGDGSGGGDSTEIMRQAGYEPVLEATGASFIDLNQDEVVVRKPAGPVGLPEYSLDRTAVEAPVLISLPVLKVHDNAIISLSCKNLMGITASQVYGRPRQQLHDADVQKVICDVVGLRTPDFAIVDGIVGSEGDAPMQGRPVPMNLVIAGRNPVSVDAVGAAIMGYDAHQIEHLSLLASRGKGVIELTKLTIKGNSIADVQRHFSRQ